MSRDPGRENALLRARLRRAEELLRVAAAALEDDPARKWLAGVLVAGIMDADGVSQRPPSILTREPVAGNNPQQE
jgi:hypothetical protein